MLQSGGYPVFGEFPAFEPEETGFDRDPATLLPLIKGKAAKIIDPHLTKWPDMPNVRVIWLDRDRTEQAKSQVKFLRLIGGLSVPNSAIKAFSRSYGEDTAVCMAMFVELGIAPLRLRFESILGNPWSAAEAIKSHIGADWLNSEYMAGSVIRRRPGCQEGMDIEMSLCSASPQEILNGSV